MKKKNNKIIPQYTTRISNNIITSNIIKLHMIVYIIIDKTQYDSIYTWYNTTSQCDSTHKNTAIQ